VNLSDSKQTFNSSFRYTNDVQSLNNSRYASQLSKGYYWYSNIYFYLDLHFEIDNGGWFKTRTLFQ